MEPLFVANLDTLKSRLRLSGTTGVDPNEQVATAVRQARVGFYDRLGESRVSQIVAITRGDPPTTADQITRERAELCETLWVKMLLIQALPVLFMEAAGVTQQAWNEEGLTRGLGSKELQKMVDNLQVQIDDYLSGLDSGEAETSSLHVSVIGPDTAQPLPGASIAP